MAKRLVFLRFSLSRSERMARARRHSLKASLRNACAMHRLRKLARECPELGMDDFLAALAGGATL